MLRNDTQRKMEALLLLAANAKEEFSDGMLTLWMELLAPYSPEAVWAAIKHVVENYRYRGLPPFSELKKALLEQENKGTDQRMLQAIAEWGLLLEKIQEFGSQNPPTLHPTTQYVLRLMGGWQAACMWTQKELPFCRKDFLEYWVETHGKTDALSSGATGVAQALQMERSANNTVHVSSILNRFLTANHENAMAS